MSVQTRDAKRLRRRRRVRAKVRGTAERPRLAANAKQAGITACVFDRAGYLYHGRVKALADGAREGGLKF